MRLTLTLLAATLAWTPLAAQEHGDHDRNAEGSGKLPDGWTARTDNGRPLTNLKFETMAPGWHLTTGPAAILYRAADRADGPLHAEAKLHVFPASGHHEGYGIFLGGRDLAGDNISYTYFLLRGDGKYLIKRRTGATTSTLVNWTDSDAIVKAKTDGPVENVLAVEVGRDTVAFMVNGKKVHALPASQVDTRGVVGLRANHNLNLHVETLGVRSR